jgi:4-amino-4-deoxychorismate lyase
MPFPVLIDGRPGDGVPAGDRGLAYGDGVFRTLRIRNGVPLFWTRHYDRLHRDAAALGIAAPPEHLLRADIAGLAHGFADASVKIIITRGDGERGYAPGAETIPRRVVSVHSLPSVPAPGTVCLRFCTITLSDQPRLAGIKHLNRLENVLARAEWQDPQIFEGLMCNSDGHVIEGTRCNLFIVEEGRVVTPLLDRCGVAGITRDWVIEQFANEHPDSAVEDIITRQRLQKAGAVFLTNSLLGIIPVDRLGETRWQTPHPLVTDLQNCWQAACA